MNPSHWLLLLQCRLPGAALVTQLVGVGGKHCSPKVLEGNGRWIIPLSYPSTWCYIVHFLISGTLQLPK